MEGFWTLAGVAGWLIAALVVFTAETVEVEVIAALGGVAVSALLSAGCIARAIGKQSRKTRGEST